VDWQLAHGTPATAAPLLRSALAQSLADNAMADALPLFEVLAGGRAAELALPGAGLLLRLLPMQPPVCGNASPVAAGAGPPCLQ
jgi:hypothetical protein